MNVGDIIKMLDASIVTGNDHILREVEYAFASDLMSDVLTLERDRILLITGLSNLQAVRTAEMSDINTIIVGRNKTISEDMIKVADENDIVMIQSAYSVFHIAGELFRAGIKPIY